MTAILQHKRSWLVDISDFIAFFTKSRKHEISQKTIHKKSEYIKNKNINRGYYSTRVLIFLMARARKTDLSATRITQKHNMHKYNELITWCYIKLQRKSNSQYG